MALTFPNTSRSYDETARRVRFLGHDGMFEVKFFVDIGAFSKIASRAPSEADCLAAFDAARSSVQDIARKAYGRDRRDSYVLTEAHFK
ncbi:DUF1488 domain-containing protein [Rhizobium sp. PL01]|uniref:DUF1488 domain-containing protein n=1 Tax=Rhizobium sp. PL01 TaxID=3085631 RepID=UPI002982AF89|nr:DUF1488 domain-containing protein [Rhizobium sp. PL01]MDW5313313.1 DUF1488 domain-containing protein [Rhizobium sp. PL01]